MNHADRRLALRALRTTAVDLEGPGPAGADALVAAVGKRSAVVADPAPRPPGTSGGTSYADPTPGAAVDPTRGVKILEEFDLLIHEAQEAMDKARNLAAREYRRVTPQLLPPEQKKLQHCTSCQRVGYDNNVDPDLRYKDQCRRCGDWKKEHGHLPPKGIVDHWRKGFGNLTSKIVADAYKAEGRTPPAPEPMPARMPA